MDFKSRFWQIGIAEGDKHKKKYFQQVSSLYQFTLMLFKLANSPSTFERLIENVFRGLQLKDCLIYINDIIVPGKAVEETLQRLDHVLEGLQTVNLKLKPLKCNMFRREITVLGHAHSETGVYTDPDKI